MKPLAWSCLSLVALALFACKPAESEEEELPPTPVAVDEGARTLAEQLCGATFSCDCNQNETFASEAECVSMIETFIQTQIDDLTAIGGEWDAECAGQLVRAFERWACLGSVAALDTYAFDVRACHTLSGGLSSGADCFLAGIIDECESGLSCLSGQCYPVESVPVPAGGVCEFGWENLPCASGSYCDYDEDVQTYVCEVAPALGEPCNPADTYLCGPPSNDLFCDANTSTCVAAPGEGEPCFDNFLCGPDTYCDGGKDFTCQPRAELGDGCGSNAVCPDDANCINNICEPAPAHVCSAYNWLVQF